MDRRDFIRLGATGVTVAMIPVLPGCSTASLPAVDRSQGPLAIGTDGTRFELRPNAHQLVISGSQGERKVGGVGTAPGKLNYPIRLAIASGVAYVVECGNHRVQVFDAVGTSLALIGEGELNYPKGVAIAGAELLVADSRNHRIVGFDPNGDLTTSYGADVLSAPCGIVALGDTMLVADPGLGQVVELDRRGRIVARFGGDFILPYDVAWDGTNAYVADAARSELSVHDRDGRRTGSIPLDGAATFVSFAADGMLYAG